MDDVTVLLESHNKKKYVMTAIDSVLVQSYPNFKFWIVENSTDKDTQDLVELLSTEDDRISLFKEEITDAQRRAKFMHPYFINKYWEIADTEFVAFIADDDFWEKDFLYKLHKELEDSSVGAAYCTTKYITESSDGKREDYAVQRAASMGARFGPTSRTPCGLIDGAGALYRRRLLDELEKPWWPEDWENYWQCDGLFMQKFTSKFWMAPVPDILLIHRCTPQSYSQSNKGRLGTRSFNERLVR